tara:strand:- start:322 stop:660 length:339 start_codon:yes stop_codon:yes gene_type:complete
MVDIKKLNKQMADTGMNRTIGMQLSDGQKAMQENDKLKKRIEELEKALEQSPERVSVDAVVMQHKEIRQLAVDAIDFLRCLEEEGEFKFWEEGYNTQVLRELREYAKKLGVA